MDNRLPKVFAIILNYNGKETVVECLNSVFQSNYANMEVVVVDNNSTDGSLELIKNRFQKAHIIKNSANLGFAAGNNVAIRFALEKFADYVFLLNNDATIEKNTLIKMVREAENNADIAIANPLIFKKKNGPIWFGGGKILWHKMRSVHTKPTDVTKNYKSQYATGCALLVHKKVFKDIGLFDESFFLYYEDVDFSYRAGKVGYESYIIPTAHAYHAEKSEISNENKLYWLVLSGLIFFNKNSTAFFKTWIVLYSCARKIKNLLILFAFRKDSRAKQIRRAFIDFKKHAS